MQETLCSIWTCLHAGRLDMGLRRYDEDLHRFRGFVAPSPVHSSGNDGRITWHQKVICFAQSQYDFTVVNKGKLVVGRRPRMLSAQTAGSQFHQKRVELAS